MDIFHYFDARQRELLSDFAAAGRLPPLTQLPLDKVTVEPPRDASHGDLASNAALVLAKPAGVKSPRQLAEQIAEAMQRWEVTEAVSIAGPGFINLRLNQDFWRDVLRDILASGADYGRSTVGAGQTIHLEYVSANPTGPLHIGHARGAVIGDVLGNLLALQGFSVVREYYVNDSGVQMDTLARSTYLRYREAFGETITIPADLYPGDYLKAVAEALKSRDGARWLDADEALWLAPVRDFAGAFLLDLIQQDLTRFGVQHNQFISERSLVERGAVEQALSDLEARGLIYKGQLPPPKGAVPDDWEPRTQRLFRATDFGDDVDRPVQKSDGAYTYFANDVAYHRDKWQRSGGTLINIFGADHRGYVKRMQAAVTALSDQQSHLEVLLYNLVSVVKEGVPVKLSKRMGNIITLRDVIDWIGRDAFRYALLTRKASESLMLDVDLMRAQARENPLFYVQYAHARCHSVMRMAKRFLPQGIETVMKSKRDLAWSELSDADWALIKVLAQWPRIARNAALQREPQRLTAYLSEFAASFHALWTQGRDQAQKRFVVEDNLSLTAVRLELVQAVMVTLQSGFACLGITPLDELT